MWKVVLHKIAKWPCDAQEAVDTALHPLLSFFAIEMNMAPNYRLHLTARGTLSPDINRRRSHAAGDAWR